MSPRTALFPGTFDPFTNGHLDLTRRAARLFDRVIVAVAPSPAKGTLFAVEERVEMIRAAIKPLRQVEVVDFSELVVDCARRVGAQVMIRGLRAVSDFEFEFQMALMNRKLAPSIEVAFLMPSQQYTYLNSTLVKEVARLGGGVRGLVPKNVEARLLARFREERAAAKPAAAKSAAKSAARSGNLKSAIVKAALLKPALAKAAVEAAVRAATKRGGGRRRKGSRG